ncbi:MAG: hypothetical protein ACYC0B_02120 [Gemmatimonadaceae bacterium]
MPRLPDPAYRLDLWTDVRAAGGTRVAFLVEPGGGRAATRVQRTRFLEPGRSSLSCEVASDYHALSALAPQAAVVCLTRFVPTGPDSYVEQVEEWRVASRRRTVRGGVGPYRIGAVPIEDDLLDRDYYREVSSGGLSQWGYSATERTPADVLGDVAARLPAWIEVGTVTPTAPVTIPRMENATPRAIVTALVEALAAQGVDAEFQFTLAADLSAYRLELVTRVAGSLSALPATTAANATELDYDEDALEQASVLIPFTPDGVDLREWQFAATAIDAGTGWITVAALNGAAAQLVAVDAQFNGLYLHRELTGRNFAITDTSVSPLRVRVAVADLASGIAVGERLSLRATEDLAGTRRAFGTPALWSPFAVVSTLSGPPRITVSDLADASAVVLGANQWRDWTAERSQLVAGPLPAGDFNHLTGVLDLGSAPSAAPVAGDWVWFGTACPPGTVTAYDPVTFAVTVVPRYANTQFTESVAGVTTARLYRPIGTPLWIVSSAASGTGELTVDAFTAGTPAGTDVLEVRQRCQGARLVELADPTAVDETREKYGTLQVACTGATNRIPNADMGIWSGGPGDPADGWSIESIVGTVTRTRTTDPLYTRYGGASERLDFAAGASAEHLTPRIPIHAVPGMDQVASAVALLFVRFTGAVPIVVTLYAVTADGARTALGDPIRVYPLDTTVSTADDFKAAMETWYDAVHTNESIAALVDEQLQIGIARPPGASNPACTVYVDAAMLLQREGLPQAADGGVQYVFGSDADPMVAATNVALQDRGRPLVSFTGRFLDVYRLDATRYAPHELVLGRDVALTIPALALTRAVRLLGISEDLDAPASVQVHLDRVRPDVGRLMAARMVPRAPTRDPVTGRAPNAVWLDVQEVPTSTQVTVTWDGAPAVTVEIDSAPPVTPAPSPIVIARNAPGGAEKVYVFVAANDQGERLSSTVRVAPEAAPVPAIGPVSVSRLSGTTFEVDWSVSGMPLGVTYRIVWAITADGSGSGVQNGATNPQTIGGATLGPTPYCDVDVQARDADGVLLVSRLYSAPMIL